MEAYNQLSNEGRILDISQRITNMVGRYDFERMHKFVTEGERLINIRKRLMNEARLKAKEVRKGKMHNVLAL